MLHISMVANLHNHKNKVASGLHYFVGRKFSIAFEIF